MQEAPSITFIEPCADNANVFDQYMKLPLLGTLYLATILHNNGYNTQILNENILKRKIDPFEVKSEIFCITALTVSANRAKLLAGQLKKIYPNAKVFIGGIHASLVNDDYLNVADKVIIGEAEDIILDLVEGKYEEQIVYGNLIENLNDLPLINYSLLVGYKDIELIPIMTSRGCPFDCSFCTVTKIFGKRFRMQTPERIVSEIKNAVSYVGNKNIFFYDDNFTANKSRINKLCELFEKENLELGWSIQVRSDLAEDIELVKRMANVGLSWVFIGFESINDETLEAYNKSQTKKDIENSIDVFHLYGINIHGMFMLGDDCDTSQNIRSTVDFAIRKGIDTVQFMILTPFPGTQIYNQLERENRIYHKNWDYYNAMFTVFQPKNMTPVKLIEETYRAYRKFYSLRRTILGLLYLFLNTVLNAFVWNFKRLRKDDIETLVVRMGASFIITKYTTIYKNYLKYLEKLEREMYINS